MHLLDALKSSQRGKLAHGNKNDTQVARNFFLNAYSDGQQWSKLHGDSCERQMKIVHDL